MPRLIASLGFAAGILASTGVGAAEISISCSALGKEHEICKQGVDAWAKRTGNTVKIVSTPGGATVSINGSKVGTTPATVTIPGYSMLSIELRRAGFKTQRLRHYSKRNGEVVAARLEKGR